MKNKNHFSLLISGIFILSFFVFSLCSCNRQSSKNKAGKENRELPSPSMDIHAATFLGNLEEVRLHIAAGTDLNSRESLGNSTALITASVFGKTEIALALIHAGADLNLQNNDGSTALHCAALFCYPEIVESLLENGADITILNSRGESAFDIVSAPFSEMKDVYDFFSRELGQLGLRLDYEHIAKTRPVIASMLKENEAE